MRLRVAALVLLVVGGGVRSLAGGAALSGPLPAAIGDVSTWTIITGEFHTPGARGQYRFYVSPQRQALYQLMRYDVEIIAPGNDLEVARRPGERVVFAEEPGSREPLLCWEWQPAPGAGAWRAVPPGTDAYRLEMMTLMRVLAVHRAVRRQSEP